MDVAEGKRKNEGGVKRKSVSVYKKKKKNVGEMKRKDLEGKKKRGGE